MQTQAGRDTCPLRSLQQYSQQPRQGNDQVSVTTGTEKDEAACAWGRSLGHRNNRALPRGQLRRTSRASCHVIVRQRDKSTTRLLLDVKSKKATHTHTPNHTHRYSEQTGGCPRQGVGVGEWALGVKRYQLPAVNYVLGLQCTAW